MHSIPKTAGKLCQAVARETADENYAKDVNKAWRWEKKEKLCRPGRRGRTIEM